MIDLASEHKSPIKPVIKVEHQILKEYSQSYFWGHQIKSIAGKVAPGVIKFFTHKEVKENEAKLSFSPCIRVFWRVKGKLWGNSNQKIDIVILGDCLDFAYRNERIGLESVELFINSSGDIVSDIKLTFFDLHKGGQESYNIIEVEPMYLSSKKLTKMTNLYEFVSDLIDMALENNAN